MDSDIYLCEADNVEEGVNRVTAFSDTNEALKAAKETIAAVHFISTVNPLADVEEAED